MGYYDKKMNDWRGIAMLTQQMSQLFEPSKARLMSRQQEHEMNMMLAKKAWEMQSEDINVKKTKYENINKEIEKYSLDLQGKNLKDLVAAGTKDGATPDESVTVLEKTALKRLDEMQDIASQYHTMIMEKQKVLDNFVIYDTEAKRGESFANDLVAPTTEKRKGIVGKNYKRVHDADKSGTLSWGEQNNVMKDYIKDYYAVPEGKEGMDITIGGETMQALPEAHAFVSGFRHVRGIDKADATEIATQAKKAKTPDQYLNVMYKAKNTIQDYEQQGLTAADLATLVKGELPDDFTTQQVNEFIVSNSLYKEAYKAYIKEDGVVPDDLKGVAPVSPDMFIEGESWWGLKDDQWQFSQEGLNYDKYIEIQKGDNQTYKDIAFNIVYNWEDIMKTGSDTEKANMLKSFELLKKQYNF